MCFYEGEPAECVSVKIRKARKPHRCEGCEDGIDKGDRYEFVSGIFDGEPFSFAHCGVCKFLQGRIHDIEIEEGCSESESWCPIEDVREYAKEHNMRVPTKQEGQEYLHVLV